MFMELMRNVFSPLMEKDMLLLKKRLMSQTIRAN